MAGKSTSIYVSIAVKGNPFEIVEKKQFFTAKQANTWLKEVEEKYPSDKFRVTKETY